MALAGTFLCAVILVFGGRSAEAKEHFSKTIGDVSVELITPKGHCVMDPAYPSDASFLSTVGGVFAKSHNMLSAFADCGEQKKWRTGEQRFLNSFGQIITPLAMMRAKVPVPRGIFAAQVCAQMKKMQGEEMNKLMSEMKKRVERHIEGSKFNEMKFLTGTNSDKDACYAPSQQKITTPDGATKTLASVSAITLVKGKMVQINLYNLFEDEGTYLSLFTQQKDNIERLLAIAGNQ